MRAPALVVALAVLAGCSTQIAYWPDEAVLEGFGRDQREQMFAETLSRARKPPIAQVWIDDSSYGYDRPGRYYAYPYYYGDPYYGPYYGHPGRRRIVYFANVGELRLYSNNAVFVVDTTGRVVDKLVFGTQEDAVRMIDLMAAYRAQRYRAETSPGPGPQQRGHRYDRRYEAAPRPDPYDDRGPYDMEGNRRAE
jgi:hypothetical protein